MDRRLIRRYSRAKVHLGSRSGRDPKAKGEMGDREPNSNVHETSTDEKSDTASQTERRKQECKQESADEAAEKLSDLDLGTDTSNHEAGAATRNQVESMH